ncbi:50S ribosomal protein L3 N(5)-glutamine methyltransferase [Elongatibacter sediminis]|uniref:50S ribosomal protein L3 N(5)-glutamine methyltransferase n=1 Tax=Elongatibacter sediminis TaxID=3119006 RepID=A0AAW9RH51_9GAMM
MHLNEWIERVAQRLENANLHYGHGTACARDEAAWLVRYAAGLPVDSSLASSGSAAPADPELDEEAGRRIERLLTERIDRRVPLAYLTGRAWFAGLEFEVDESVLVPRSPVAELILEGFQPWVPPERLSRALDLCTGSGCIGIAMAVHLPGLRVDASDISAAALEVARRNVQRHGVADRVELIRSDLFAGLAGRRYDLIVTNPPYVPAASLPDLPGEYRAEPALGLESGDDGLDACLRIMLQSPSHLEETGILVCEVGESDERLEHLLPEVPFLWLEFSHGGGGVFVLDRVQLEQARPAIERCTRMRGHV